MYSDKLTVAVKVDRKVLRENKDTVYIPFGSEFSILIKNLNSVRALVKVWIDGEDVTEGISGLIVYPNDSIELERYIKDGNLHKGNRFKFIERTAKISQHRGNKIDDGLIRIEFEFEQQPRPRPHPPYPIMPLGEAGDIISSAPDSHYSQNAARLLRDMAKSKGLPQSSQYTSDTSSEIGTVTEAAGAITTSEIGITVPGSTSFQTFTWGTWFPTDGIKHVMVLQMLGEVEGRPIKRPITVKSKIVCSVCGTSNKPGTKFCRECGASLQIA